MNWNNTDSIIFDMDGTLWDAVDTYAYIWNVAFKRCGLPFHETREALISCMGLTIEEIFKKQDYVIPADKEADFLNEIVKIETDTMLKMGGKPYPMMREGIEELSKKYKLFLVSNCSKRGLPAFMEFTKTTSFFTDYLSNGDEGKQKWENMLILKEKYGLKAPLYIGDTESDSIATRKAGMPFVFAEYGFGTTHDYDLKFSSFADFCNYFSSLK